MIKPGDLLVLICIESFRHDNRDPFPSELAISKRAHMTTRSVRRHLESLEANGIIKRCFRKRQTTVYRIEPLILKLDEFAKSSLPPGKNSPPGEDKTRRYERTVSSTRKDPRKNKLNNSRGLESIQDLIEKHPTKFNDFGKRKEWYE